MEIKKEPHSSSFRGTPQDLSLGEIRIPTDSTTNGEPKMKDYILIKLKSGEEILGAVISKNRQGIKVNRPMQIRQVPFVDPLSGSIKSATVMDNWIGRTNEIEITIPNSWVGIKMVPAQDIVDAYEKYKEREDIAAVPVVELAPELPPKNTEQMTELREIEKQMNQLFEDINSITKQPNSEEMPMFITNLESPHIKDASKDAVVVNFIIPPNIFKNLVEEGIIQDLMMGGMDMEDNDDEGSEDPKDSWGDSSDIEDDVSPKKSTKKIVKNDPLKDWGNSFIDWSPDPNDYLKGST
jgi:hypothetical protein